MSGSAELAELTVAAIDAVEDQDVFIPVVDPVRLPTFIITGEPDLPALLTRWN